MGCENCDREQESREKEYYYRIGKANILIFGCEKHIKEMFDKLNGKVE